MTTGTYPIDATNNLEPLDSRYVADFPAELRAMKTRMNSAISSIGTLTGALMSDGTNYMTGKLGVGGVASAGLMFYLYGNARMEGTVTVIGKQDITGSSFVPSNATVTNAASIVRGAYGGGYLMVDGTGYGGSWLAAGSMFWGLGTSAGLAEKVLVSSNDFQFTSDLHAVVTSKASNGYASFNVSSSGTHYGYIFFGNASGERARIVVTPDAGMQFCLGTGAERVLSLNANKSASLYGSEISIGIATPGEKRLRLHNEYGSAYLFMSTGGELGLYDSTAAKTRWKSALDGTFSAPTLRATDATKTLGYDAGTGGAVTQLTNKSTMVTINKPTGRIVTHNESMAPGVYKYFPVSNSLVTANSVVCVSADPTTCSAVYNITTYASNGSFIVMLHNASGVTLTDAIGINFVVLNGAAS